MNWIDNWPKDSIYIICKMTTPNKVWVRDFHFRERYCAGILEKMTYFFFTFFYFFHFRFFSLQIVIVRYVSTFFKLCLNLDWCDFNFNFDFRLLFWSMMIDDDQQPEPTNNINELLNSSWLLNFPCKIQHGVYLLYLPTQ